MDVRLKRAYEPAASSDGYRILIDRLWPRGVSRDRAKLDEYFVTDCRRSKSSGAGHVTGHSPSSTPPVIGTTRMQSSSPRSYAADSRRGRVGVVTGKSRSMTLVRFGTLKDEGDAEGRPHLRIEPFSRYTCATLSSNPTV